MALPGAAARGGLWRLGPAALSPPRGPMQPQLALAVSSSPLCSQVRSLSSRASSRALVAAVAAAARRVSARYERYLERSWPRFYLLHSTFKTGAVPGGAGDQEDQGQDGPAAAEPAAAPVPRHGAPAPVPQGRAQGHSHRDHRHPPLRQLPGACPDVFLPSAAADQALLDAQAAAGVPGCLRLPPQGLVPGRAAGAGAGSALPARGPAPAAPPAALCPGAGRCPARPGPAPGCEEFVLGVPAGAQQAPGGSCGLLPAWAELHSPGPGRVPGVAGAVAQALL
ncbi:formin-like protein 18 isoform X2 [Onychostruthus taczanowskii]|uniref:formin-like protein 18 isoform X2 n=1 Tax=Onychostruthus taczanowskii TaxID=356909 RepID=UPI001B8080FB|nr:formin-like protein 18 isoform X2 [Onychostruthus taczanowskii]